MNLYDDVTTYDTGALALENHESNRESADHPAAAAQAAEEHAGDVPTAATELDAAVSAFVAANRRLVQLVHAAKRQGLGSSEIVRRTSAAWPPEITLDILAKFEQTARAAQVLRNAGISVADEGNDREGDVVVSLHSSWSRRLVCLHINRPEASPESTRWAALAVVGALHTAGYRLLVHPGSRLTASSAIEYFADPAGVLVIEEPDSATSYTTYL
ncbi:hypothetical protein ACIA8C_04705 [Nocardia sp. NPDC051321]|uniref:hypothetical protein n=1 Tax=Nocardia sp. NPDC051321 TaxID=3364323 RepID=UPI0037AEC6C0